MSTTDENEIETAFQERRKEARRRRHRVNRRQQRDGHRGREAWREAPATPEQLEALRTIASTTGRTFEIDVNRGEAWKRIKSAPVTIPAAIRRRCAPPWVHG